MWYSTGWDILVIIGRGSSWLVKMTGFGYGMNNIGSSWLFWWCFGIYIWFMCYMLVYWLLVGINLVL